MINIHFISESDITGIENVEKARQEYEEIWKEHGEEMVKAIEVCSGLVFRETFINVFVSDTAKISTSHPMCLKADKSKSEKNAILMHELSHRILFRQRVLENKEDLTDSTLLHFHMNLFLFDAWKKVFGEQFAKDAVRVEKAYALKYKEAWEKFEKTDEYERMVILNTVLPSREG